MKRIFFVSFFVMSFSLDGFADVGRSFALISGAMVGSSAVVGNASLGRMPEEIEDWKDLTNTTTSLSKICGMIVETRLLKGNRENYLFLGLSNPTKIQKNLVLNKVEFHFGSGKVRFINFTPRQSVYELKAGWYVWGVVPFPRKTDFKDEKSFVFKLPVKDASSQDTCIVRSKHIRNQSVPVDKETHLEYTSMDIALEFGADVLRSGKIKSSHTTDSDYSFAMRISGYSSLHHGLDISVFANGLGSVVASEYPTTPTVGAEARGVGAGMGYTYRGIISGNHYYYFSVGGAYNTVHVVEGKENKLGSFSFFTAYGSISYDYTFGSIKLQGMSLRDQAIGVTIMNNYFPAQEDNGLKFDGLLTSVLLRYRMGF